MRFEPRARAIWQSILEIVRDQLHKLLARQIVGVGHGAWRQILPYAWLVLRELVTDNEDVPSEPVVRSGPTPGNSSPHRKLRRQLVDHAVLRQR
jgi:hypothetical protein